MGTVRRRQAARSSLALATSRELRANRKGFTMITALRSRAAGLIALVCVAVFGAAAFDAPAAFARVDPNGPYPYPRCAAEAGGRGAPGQQQPRSGFRAGGLAGRRHRGGGAGRRRRAGRGSALDRAQSTGVSAALRFDPPAR